MCVCSQPFLAAIGLMLIFCSAPGVFSPYLSKFLPTLFATLKYKYTLTLAFALNHEWNAHTQQQCDYKLFTKESARSELVENFLVNIVKKIIVSQIITIFPCHVLTLCLHTHTLSHSFTQIPLEKVSCKHRTFRIIFNACFLPPSLSLTTMTTSC